jgi:hypothetical protein
MDVVIPNQLLTMKNMRYYSILAIAFLLQACKPEDTFDGPNLEDIYGPFFIEETLTISDDSLDLAAGETTHFHASFSKNLNWKLEVQGMSSGARHVHEEFSSAVDFNWNGSTTILPMFRQEMCEVLLTFDNQLDTLRDTLEVLSIRPAQGFVLSDFESGINPGWTSFIQSGSDMSFLVRGDGNAAQGNNYYDMGGAVTWDWLIGLIDMPASAYGVEHFPLSNNSNNVFFNTMIYKPEAYDNGLTLIQFREDDNGDGSYSNGIEDLWAFEISGGPDGWSTISRKYEDIVTLVNGAETAPIGNGLHEPDKLVQVSILFLANPASGYSQAYLDYVTFTEGGPLQP